MLNIFSKYKIKIDWTIWAFLLFFTGFLAFIVKLVHKTMPMIAEGTEAQVPLGTSLVGGAFTLLVAVMGGLILLAVLSLVQKMLRAAKSAVSLEKAATEGDVVDNITEEEVIDIFPFYEEVKTDHTRMITALREIQAGRYDAKIRISDAYELSNSLAGLARGAVEYMTQLRDEGTLLREIIDALDKRDTDRLAIARGALDDDGISNLILMSEVDPTQTERARRAIYAQVGVYTSQVRAINYLITGWMNLFEEARGEVARLETVAKRLEAGQFVLMIDNNLAMAQDALRAYRNPDAVVAAEQLPDSFLSPANTPRMLSA